MSFLWPLMNFIRPLNKQTVVLRRIFHIKFIDCDSYKNIDTNSLFTVKIFADTKNSAKFRKYFVKTGRNRFLLTIWQQLVMKRYMRCRTGQAVFFSHTVSAEISAGCLCGCSKAAYVCFGIFTFFAEKTITASKNDYLIAVLQQKNKKGGNYD